LVSRLSDLLSPIIFACDYCPVPKDAKMRYHISNEANYQNPMQNINRIDSGNTVSVVLTSRFEK
jgi:NADPH-dependent curcumin reductase CurA